MDAAVTFTECQYGIGGVFMSETAAPKKFCKHCGKEIASDAVLCVNCGRQVEEVHASAQAPNIVINNANSNVNTIDNGVGVGRQKNKWVAFCLCLFLGYFGAHKFYEGKVGMGILYLFTVGLFGIGWIIDLIVLLTKPNPYFV